MEYEGLDFRLTCEACPEQYDVYDGYRQVGYVRLRWGYLSCECPDYPGEDVYEFDFNDEWKGCMTSAERNEVLQECAKAIRKWIEENPEESDDEW